MRLLASFISAGGMKIDPEAWKYSNGGPAEDVSHLIESANFAISVASPSRS